MTAGASPSTTWPLIGRSGELDRVMRLLTARGRRRRGVLLTGGAGVGKTRFAQELTDRLRRRGRAVEAIRATEGTRSVPLGAFASLVDDPEPAVSRDDMLRLTASQIRARAGNAGLVVVVDDAHLLDEASVALLDLLAATPAPIRLLLGVRDGEPIPSPIHGLWKDELLERVALDPLDRDATEALVSAVLGDAAARALAPRVWTLTRGNALFVRELILAASDRQAAGRAEHLVASPTKGPHARLLDLVSERVRLVDSEGREALDVVAVAERIPVEVAERLVAPDVLAGLEARHLVELADDAGTAVVQIAHPLYGEVLREALPRLRRRQLLARLVAELERSKVTDPLLLATWRLEAGDTGDPPALVAGAREALARFDHVLARRLAEAAGAPARADAALVLGQALAVGGRIAEAEAVFAALDPGAPDLTAKAAIARAGNLFWGLKQASTALAVLSQAEAALEGAPEWRAECSALRSQLLMYCLQIDDALALAEDVLGEPAARVPARLRAAAAATALLAAKGRIDRALAVSAGLLDVAAGHRREAPHADVNLRQLRGLAFLWAGRFDEAQALYDEFSAGTSEDELPTPLLGLALNTRGRLALVRGHHAEACEALARSDAALGVSDWLGVRPWVRASWARATVFAGDLVEAEAVLAAWDADHAADPERGRFSLPDAELSRNWLLAAQGRREEAVERCVAQVTVLEHLVKPQAVAAAHAAARLGGAAEVAKTLERLAGEVDGPLPRACAAHASALAAGDADGLEDAAGAFEAIGAHLLAAEAFRSAANTHHRAGRRARGHGAARRCDELLARCGHPDSPALEPVAVWADDLSAREREVALLAAQGRSSQEVAGHLGIGVRTVDTHLHRVYRKLEIAGRGDLPAALGLTHSERT